MKPRVFIFIGRSGCGKGSQVELLKQVLITKGVNNIYHLETGARFREFISQAGYSSGLAKTIMERGERQPDFLAVWMWSHLLVENLTGGETLVFDGTPRSLSEAKMLDTALAFYLPAEADRVVIYLNISHNEAANRLAQRGRSDDHGAAQVEKRLSWFDTDVLPAVEYYRQATKPYNFIEVNGEQTIEAISAELLAKVGLS